MSIEAAQTFWNQCSTDTQLQARFADFNAESKPEDVLDRFVTIGAEHGHTFSPNEAAEVWRAASRELSDADLDSVSGGATTFWAVVPFIGGAL